MLTGISITVRKPFELAGRDWRKSQQRVVTLIPARPQPQGAFALVRAFSRTPDDTKRPDLTGAERKARGCALLTGRRRQRHDSDCHEQTNAADYACGSRYERLEEEYRWNRQCT